MLQPNAMRWTQTTVNCWRFTHVHIHILLMRTPLSLTWTEKFFNFFFYVLFFSCIRAIIIGSKNVLNLNAASQRDSTHRAKQKWLDPLAFHTKLAQLLFKQWYRFTSFAGWSKTELLHASQASRWMWWCEIILRRCVTQYQ